ncbi:MAG: DUF4384 domain-containing protein [Alphaproteobacteria bacterium]|nr:DUF4384 domain-containing protein [Alphaproteobacteria bacterium]
MGGIAGLEHAKGAVLRLFVLCVLFLAGPGLVAAGAEDDPVDRLVAELTAGLSSHFAGDACASPRSLGVWPFDVAQVPVSAIAADQLYSDLVAELVAGAPSCLEIMDGEGIGAVLSYLHRSGALGEAGGNPVAALEAANRAVDIVILPRLFVRGGAVMLSLKAVARDSGRTLAQTAAAALPAERTEVALADTARDLESAVRLAVQGLSGQVHDMNRLVPAGIFFQDTGAQPDFARYFQERVVAGLVAASSNLITGRVLSVLEPEFDLGADLGRSLSPRDLDPLARIAERDGADGLYQLRGTYWRLGDVLDITLTVQGIEGKAGSWQGRLGTAGLGGMALEPTNAGLGDDQSDAGSFAILMTSPRGENPVYHPGEELTVYFRTDRRVWLYCFYIDSGGAVTEVLPNIFLKDFAQGHMLAPYVLHALPDPRRDPFTFRIDDSTLGEERLKCIAATRNVSEELPPALRGQSFDPIPNGIAAEIDTIFDGLANVQLARASVTMTIAPPQ